MFNLYNSFVINEGGLSSIVDSVRNNWVGPAFFLVVAGVSLYFLIHREIRKLLVFILIVAIVGALIFFTSDLFGNNGSLTNAAKEIGSQVNMIIPHIKY